MSRMTSIAAIPMGPNPRRRAGTRSPNDDAAGARTDASGRGSDNHSPPLKAPTNLRWIYYGGRPILPELPFRLSARIYEGAVRFANKVSPLGVRPASPQRRPAP